MEKRTAAKFRDVMQGPVTPFRDDYSLDIDVFQRDFDFPMRTGAEPCGW